MTITKKSRINLIPAVPDAILSRSVCLLGFLFPLINIKNIQDYNNYSSYFHGWGTRSLTLKWRKQIESVWKQMLRRIFRRQTEESHWRLEKCTQWTNCAGHVVGMGRWRKRTHFCRKPERYHLHYLGVDGRKILKRILEKQAVKLCTIFKWIRIGSSARAC